MGIINKGANGPFRGKTGSVVGSGWKKIDYIKGLPRRYKNKGKPSTEQELQRKKFHLLNSFLAPLTPITKIGFQSFLSKATARNIAFQYNYDHAFTLSETGEPQLNYPALQFSHGSLFCAGAEKAEWIDKRIKISWNPKTYHISGELDDEAHIICYFPDKHFFANITSNRRRHHGEAHTDDLPPLLKASAHIWLFFSDSRRKRVSRSIYLSLTAEL